MQENQNEEVISYIKRAFELKSQECYKQAIEMLYKALETEPDNIEILFQVGELYFLLHNYDRAIQYLEKVLDSDEKHLPSLNLLCTIKERQNYIAEAADIAKKIFEQEKSENTYLKLIKYYGKLGKISNIENLMQNNSYNTPKCICECANALYQNRYIDKAKELLSFVDINNPENESCKVLLGKIYFDENEFEKSKEIFDSFQKTTQNPEILNYKGLFELENMNFVEAIKDFSKAASIDKNNAIYHYNLGNAYFYNGWQDEAVEAYKKAIVNNPENLDYKYSLAYLYFEKQEYEKTQKEIDYILAQNPEHSQAKVLLALLKLQNKDYLGSLEILENNLKQGSNDSFTLISLAKVYKELDMYKKAEDTIKKVIENSSDNPSYKIDLAEIYIKEKEYDKAVELADKIISENENYISAYLTGANASYLKGDYDKTKEFAQKALALDINCSEGYYYLALVRKNEEDFEEAIECMKRAITYDVSNAKYYAEMSNIYRQINDLKTAFEYIKEAESIDSSTEYKIIYRELAALNRKK